MAHLHNVIDDDRHFVIDPDSRLISHTSEAPITLIQNDRNSERFTFELPLEIDGHDMTACDKVQVHFLNINASNDTEQSKNVYNVTDLDYVDGSYDTLAFTWLISHEATRYIGPLVFAVRFMCTTTKTEADGSTSTIIDYSWNTKPFADVTISEGIDCSDVIQNDYYDVIDTWLNAINSRGDAVMEELNELANGLTDSIVDDITESAKQSINEFADKVKEQLGRKTLAEMGAITQMTGTATDITMSQDATTKAIEEAKTLASAEASSIRSDFNARFSGLSDSVGNLSNYKRLYPDENGYYKLEKNKLYHISHFNDGQNTAEWKMSLRCLVHGFSMEKVAGGTYTVDNIEKLLVGNTYLPEYRDRAPDIYGFQIRVINDGQLEYATENGWYVLKADLAYEIILGHEVHKVNERYHTKQIAQTTNSLHLVAGTETYTRNGLYATVAGAVYEINENPSGATFTVDANAISDIYKISTSGLVDTYAIVLDNGTVKTFTVTHGSTPKQKISRIPLGPGESYILQPDHRYFICGYGDNSLQVLDSLTDEVALTESPVATDIKATITSTGDGLNYGQMFKCYVKENAVIVYSGDGDTSAISWRPTRIEQIFAPKTKVKNIHETGTAYVYEYGWSLDGGE